MRVDDTVQYDPLEIERLNRTASNAIADYLDESESQIGIPYDDMNLLRSWHDGGDLLDVGCGAARYVGNFGAMGYAYTGIDFSERMLEVAQSRHPHLPFHLMSYRSLSFANDSFDALWSCCVLNHEPKQNMVPVLRELRRVLRPSGVIGIVMPCTGVSEEFLGETFGTEHLSLFAYWVVDELSETMRRAGFSVIEAFQRYEYESLTIVAKK